MHHRTLTPIIACTTILGAVCFDDVLLPSYQE